MRKFKIIIICIMKDYSRGFQPSDLTCFNLGFNVLPKESNPNPTIGWTELLYLSHSCTNSTCVPNLVFCKLTCASTCLGVVQ